MDMPFPRYCCMRKEDNDTGFGFSLVAIKNETGQFIEEVKPDSLAYKAGLRNRDLVIEVNGRNIMSLSHSEVVEFIRQQGNEVCLLVLDNEARVFYEDQSVVISSNMPEVKRICTWDLPFNPGEESANLSRLTLNEKLEGGVEQVILEQVPEGSPFPNTEVTGTSVAPPLLFQKSEEEKLKVVSNSTLEENFPPSAEAAVTVEPSESGSDFLVPTPAPPHSVDSGELKTVEEPEKVEEVQERVKEVEQQQASVSSSLASPPTFPPKKLQGRQAHVSRSTPSRRACMSARTTFGDKARAFDEL